MGFPLRLLLTTLAAAASAAMGGSPDVTVSVRLDREVGVASPLLYGVSLPAPGTPGARQLLPELVRNRSFESAPPGKPLKLPKAWTAAPGWAFVRRGARLFIVRETLGANAPLLIRSRQPWREYRLALFVRKIDGPGGLRVLLEVRHRGEHLRWTLGAKHNRFHTIERVAGGKVRSLGPAVPGRLEPGRFYRVAMEMRRGTLYCSVDGRLIHVVERAVLRYGGIGFDAADATVECFRITVSGRKGRLLYELDDPEKEKLPTLAAGWDALSDPRNDVRYRWRLLYPANSYLSQQIDVRKHVGGDAGICQRGIPLVAKAAYRVRLFLRGRKGAKVTVALRGEGGKTYWQRQVAAITDVWKPHEFRFTAPATDGNAALCILVNGVGQVSVDQVSLVRCDDATPYGLRRGVVEALRRLRPPVLRWPAGPGAIHHNWARGIGPRDERAVTPVAGRGKTFETAPADFGTAEFLSLCRDLGAEPILVTNPALGLRPALYWIEYCNGQATTRVGALRVSHGHPEPYGVEHWAIGAWPGVREDAAYNMAATAEAMREEQPSIRVLAPVASALRPPRDYRAIAFRIGQAKGEGVASLDDVARALKLLRGKNVRAAITDWSVAPSELGPALVAARALNLFAREAGPFAIATCGELSACTDEASPLYRVMTLFRAHALREVVSAAAEGNGADAVDVVAGRAGKKLIIRLVHVGAKPLRAKITFAGLRGRRLPAKAAVLCIDARPGSRAKAKESEAAIGDAALRLSLPPHSITVVVIPVQEKWDGLLDRT